VRTFGAATAVYEEYEELVRAAAPGFVDQLLPPHPDPVGAVAAAFPGLELPEELAAWWAWHDGTITTNGFSYPVGGSNLCFRSLGQSLREWRSELEVAEFAAEPPDMPAEDFWPPAWIPVLFTQDLAVAVDLADPPKRSGVLYRRRWIMSDSVPTVADDFPQLVEWWSTLLRIGATTWNPADEEWVTDEALVPDDLRHNPLAYEPLGGPPQEKFRPLLDY
jgi:cell wall assembly regulator SMI1